MKWTVNQPSTIGNDTFEVEGDNYGEAAYNALQQLGWAISVPESDEDEDTPDVQYDYYRHAVVGLRWVDTRTGEEYEITRITPNTIRYSHTPGQGVISAGAHCPKAWQQSVERGEYIIQPNKELSTKTEVNK